MWTRRSVATLAGVLSAFGPRSVAAAASRIMPFKTSPFPYDGIVPDSGKPFLDTRKGDQPAHTSPRGGVYAQYPTYADRSVLLADSPHFSPERPAAIVVYLHGNLATLDRDVVHRQRVVAQVAGSRLNAVLVAPQFAVNALDSSAGHFWDAGGFTRFLAESADRLATLTGVRATTFDGLPVIIAAYSGGHNPTASILAHDDEARRIRGIVFLDALFAYEDIFADWIARTNGRTFFFSAYSRASAARNTALEAALQAKGIAFTKGLPARIAPGTVAFLDAGPTVGHNDFVTHAWVADPLRAVLARVALA